MTMMMGKRLSPSFCTASGLFSKRQRSVTRRLFVTATLRPKVAICGGGFGGLSTALRLANMPWTRLTRPQITLIDKQERFAFLPMIYELATNEAEAWEIAPPFSDLLRDTPIKFHHGAINGVDFDTQIISSTAGPVEFDRVVLALGAECKNMDLVPGAKEYAMPFYTYADALRLREKLKELRNSKDLINVVIIGGGFSGVELASTVADSLKGQGSVLLVERGNTLLKSATKHNRDTAQRALFERNVIVELGTDVEWIEKDEVKLRPPQSDSNIDAVNRPADVVLWTAGSAPKSSTLGLDVSMDERKRVDVDKYLQIRGMEDKAYALGDTAGDGGQGYYGTAQVAMQQAEYAAWNVWASLTENAKLQYRYAHLGEMMVLGANDATLSTLLGVEVKGTAAWAMRRATYLARMPTDRHRMHVAASWSAEPLLRGISRMAEQARRQGSVID